MVKSLVMLRNQIKKTFIVFVIKDKTNLVLDANWTN